MPDRGPYDGPPGRTPGDPAGEGFDDLRSLAGELRPEDHELVAPPPEVWAGILAQLDHVAQDPPYADGPVAPARPLRPVGASDRGWRRSRWLVAAAAAAVLLVVGVVAGWQLGGDDGTSGRTLEVAALSNEGLAPIGRGTSGRATLVERSGAMYLDIELVDPPSPSAGYLEVWLIDEAVDGMVSLGPYRGPGSYLVPPGVDPGAFPVVDVSDEPVDGLPTHSGVSVVRGVLA